MVFGGLVSMHRFGGRGAIDGTLAVIVGSEEIPSQQSVHVYAERYFRPGNLGPAQLERIGSVMPDEAGHWRMPNLALGSRFTAISFDSSGEHAPAIQAGLLPSLD